MAFRFGEQLIRLAVVDVVVQQVAAGDMSVF